MSSFGLEKLIYTGPSVKAESEQLLLQCGVRAEFVPDLREFLSQCDIVSIHCPLKDTTRKMFNRETFSWMKHGSILINTSRGDVIDQEDLYEALVSGPLSAAGSIHIKD